MLISAGDDAPGGGAVLWESTDVANTDLPTRDAGAFGKIPFRRSRTLRAYGKKQRGYAEYSPDGRYIATWSGKLTVWQNAGYGSKPLFNIRDKTFLVGWNTTEDGTGFHYLLERGGYGVVTPPSQKPAINNQGCYRKRDITRLPVKFAPERPTEPGIFATPDKNKLRLVNRNAGRTRQILRAGTANIVASAWSRDGRQIAFTDAHGWVYRFRLGADGRFIPARKPRFGHAQNPGTGAPTVTALAFSPGGETLATGGTDGMVFLWRL